MSEPTAEFQATTGPGAPDAEGLGHVVVGRFRLVRKIGVGGMGTVFEAEQELPRRRVAVKLLHGPASPQQLRRFEEESQHLADLRHPNIASVIESGTHRYAALAVPWYAMEFVPDARPITTFAEQEHLTIAQRLRLFEQVCQAVHHAHAQDILHRDIKPANILVDPDGRPKLIDFGIARALDAAGDEAHVLTRPSELLGTLQYMSPEQLSPVKVDLDARSDVYQLGLVLYELLCRRPPYDLKASTHAQAAQIVRERTLPRPRSLNRQLSSDVEKVLLKSLRKHRDARYHTASELAADVRRALSGEAVTAAGEGLVRRSVAQARRVAARHTVAVGIGVATIALFTALAFGQWLERFSVTAKVERVITTRVSFAPGGPLRHVSVITLRDETDVQGLAVREELAGISPAAVPTLRRLHGRLMEKLVGCGAKVVAWDIFFETHHPDLDADLVEGIRRLRRSNTDVVLAVQDWRIDEHGRPRLSPAIPTDVRWGTCVAQLDPAWTWTLNLAAETGSRRRLPSLALAAAAAYWRPFTDYSFELSPWQLELRYLDGSSTDRRIVELTFTDEWFRSSSGLQRGDLVGQFFLQMPSDEDLLASTVEYGEVLRASPAQLREWFAGRVILVADWRAGRDVLVEHPDGRRLPGFAAHAVGLDWLLDGRAIRRPRPVDLWRFHVSAIFLAELVTAAVALTAALMLTRRTGPLIALNVVTAGILLIASIALFGRSGVLYAPHGTVLVLTFVTVSVWLVHRWARGALIP